MKWVAKNFLIEELLKSPLKFYNDTDKQYHWDLGWPNKMQNQLIILKNLVDLISNLKS